MRVVALEGAAGADVAKEDDLRPLADVPDEVVIEIRHIGEVALLHVRDLLEENLLGAVHKEAVARSRRILHLAKKGEDVVEPPDDCRRIRASVPDKA